MMNVIILSVHTLSVVMLNVVAPSNKEAWIRSTVLTIFFKLPFYNKRLVDTTRSES